ncbi:FkbM family methyltransferase [Aequorivita sp. 609]|uniref:FkbM family methyltransferase n=1 Tax=Aequorivita TaxID=153265 RepID=UPI00160AD149|nr:MULTISPECIES: FkbM family methyltransferase [Aequorivita]MBB6681139.1 FkbM family methyltransferase [Aequorivita sp. 609]
MINKFVLRLYSTLSPQIRNRIGRSKLLKPIRDIVLRSNGTYKQVKVLVKRKYLEYETEFAFIASIKVASKAKNRGIENTILHNSINLIKTYKTKENNAIVLDVGANFGYLSLVWANSISLQGKVIAFEPNLKVYNSFDNSIKINKLEERILLNNLAVGSKNRNVELFSDSTSSNILQSQSKNRRSTTIEMVSLDSFCNRIGLNQCDLVKIDVDGIELDILKGADKLIEICNPIFIVETNDDNKLIDFFLKRNYQILDMKLNPFNLPNTLPQNIFCIPKIN